MPAIEAKVQIRGPWYVFFILEVVDFYRTALQPLLFAHVLLGHYFYGKG